MSEENRQIFILGGTSEGRELAEHARKHGTPVVISVVSEYGEQLLPESGCVRVHRGVLDGDSMRKFMKELMPVLVLDATHPYAGLVSRQAQEICREDSIPYRRVIRTSLAERTDKSEKGVYHVSSAKQAAELLTQDARPVFLTTGSKELEQFASDPSLAKRIYVRVLPDSSALQKCEALGIRQEHVIAMQGPFSMELNRALLQQTKAGWLVTKESGSRGGYMEKLEAAKSCGADVIVIDRPSEETGISLEEAKHLIEDSGLHSREEQAGTLCLIGMGMGGGGQLTLEAAEALKGCRAVLGAPRMLADIGHLTTGCLREKLYQAEHILDFLENHPEISKAAVVYSGDTGFYSGCRSLTDALRMKTQELSRQWDVKVYPGISSVSCLCARMGTGWEDMYLASAHGRECDASALMARHERVFLLLGGEQGVRQICKNLTDGGYSDTMLTVGCRMGYPDEKVIKGTAGELAGIDAPALSAVVMERRKKEDGREA